MENGIKAKLIIQLCIFQFFHMISVSLTFLNEMALWVTEHWEHHLSKIGSPFFLLFPWTRPFLLVEPVIVRGLRVAIVLMYGWAVICSEQYTHTDTHLYTRTALNWIQYNWNGLLLCNIYNSSIFYLIRWVKAAYPLMYNMVWHGAVSKFIN